MALPQDIKDYLKESKGSFNKLSETLSSIEEYYTEDLENSFSERFSELEDALTNLSEAIDKGNDQKTEELYGVLREKLCDALFTKYEWADGDRAPMSGVDLLLQKNRDGVPLRQIHAAGFTFLQDLCDKLDVNVSEHVSEEKKQEIKSEVLSSVDRLRTDLIEIRNREGDVFSPELKEAVDKVILKGETGNGFSYDEIAGALNDLLNIAKIDGNANIRKKTATCIRDISNQATFSFDFLKDAPGQDEPQQEEVIEQDEPMQEEIIGRNERRQENTLPQIESALALFNTRRINPFGRGRVIDPNIGRETQEHVDLREAAEKLIKEKRKLDDMKENTGSVEWKAQAKRVIDEAANVGKLSKAYMRDKNFASFFGGNRLQGAAGLLREAKDVHTTVTKQLDDVAAAGRRAAGARVMEEGKTTKKRAGEIRKEDEAGIVGEARIVRAQRKARIEEAGKIRILSISDLVRKQKGLPVTGNENRKKAARNVTRNTTQTQINGPMLEKPKGMIHS